MGNVVGEEMIHYKDIKYGFEYGSATVERFCSDEKKGWVTLGIRSYKDAKHDKIKQEVQVYVTRTGKIRVHNSQGELINKTPSKPMPSRKAILELVRAADYDNGSDESWDRLINAIKKVRNQMKERKG